MFDLSQPRRRDQPAALIAWNLISLDCPSTGGVFLPRAPDQSGQLCSVVDSKLAVDVL
jgi:hypothetical protein